LQVPAQRRDPPGWAASQRRGQDSQEGAAPAVLGGPRAAGELIPENSSNCVGSHSIAYNVRAPERRSEHVLPRLSLRCNLVRSSAILRLVANAAFRNTGSI